jgi:hypothetical protein
VRRPEPEPERAQGKAPAKRTEPATIRAIAIDPAARTIKEVKLATEPGDLWRGFGTQIVRGEIARIVGGDTIDGLDLEGNEIVMVDALRQSEAEETWTFGDDDEPIIGPGIIVSYDPKGDAYSNTTFSLDQVRKLVRWGDAEDEDGDTIELGA